MKLFVPGKYKKREKIDKSSPKKGINLNFTIISMRIKVEKPINRNPIQLSLFDSVILESEKLESKSSARHAVYNVWLIREPLGYSVKKESGAYGQKLITKAWGFPNLKTAELFFHKKVLEKIKPGRKIRAYQKVTTTGNLGKVLRPGRAHGLKFPLTSISPSVSK